MATVVMVPGTLALVVVVAVAAAEAVAVAVELLRVVSREHTAQVAVPQRSHRSALKPLSLPVTQQPL